MKKQNYITIISTVASATLMLTACGSNTPAVESPSPAANPTTAPSSAPTVEPTYDELPDEMLESQTGCSKYDENYSISAEEVNRFFDSYMVEVESALCQDLLLTSVDMLEADPSALQTMGAVYGGYDAICAHGIGYNSFLYEPYDFNNDVYAMAEAMAQQGIIDESEIIKITENSFYEAGCYCVPAANLRMFFDEFYGEGVVDPESWNNYNGAFTSAGGYVITGTGIGDSGSYRYLINDIDIKANVATVSCDKYAYYMSEDGQYEHGSVIMLYKDATGVHFYSCCE